MTIIEGSARDQADGDCAFVHDIVFEDFSVELESFYTKMQIKKSNEHFDENGNILGIICLLGTLNLIYRNEDTMLHIYYGKDGKLTAYRLFLLIKRRVVCVEIFAICMILRNTEGIADLCDLRKMCFYRRGLDFLNLKIFSLFLLI